MQKMKYSKLHFNLGTPVCHKHDKNVGPGTIIEVIGEIKDKDSGAQDIKYVVFWQNAGVNQEWHEVLEQRELENMIEIADK